MKVIRLQQLMTDGIKQQKSGQFGKKLRRRQGRGWQCWGKGGTTKLLPALGHVLAAKQNPRACCPQSPQLWSPPSLSLHRASPGTGGGDSGNAHGGQRWPGASSVGPWLAQTWHKGLKGSSSELPLLPASAVWDISWNRLIPLDHRDPFSSPGFAWRASCST